ncbi:hypothetical protein EXIGLDRAFT_782623, partial [Exidia glandulosa HHB12029]
MTPTAIQFRHSHYLIFDEKGGAVRFTGSDLPDPRLEKCWALADSNDKVETPCVAFRGGVKKLVQAASPDPSRWKRWVKYHLGYRVVMALPTALEIGAIVKSVGYPASDVLTYVHKWGPSVRAVLDLYCTQGNDSTLEVSAAESARELCKDPSLLYSSDRSFTSVGSGVLYLYPVRNKSTTLPVNFGPYSACYIPTQYLSIIFDKARAARTNET